MAKRVCPFCKEKVNDDATLCMHCKSALTPLPPKEWYRTWKGLLLLFFILSLFGRISQPTQPPQSDTPEQVAAKKEYLESIEARDSAKQYVIKSLKAPTTAKWPSTLDFGVAPKLDKNGKKIEGVWEVSGYVDSQNSFGAMLRQNWNVKLKKTNNSWALLDIKFW